MKPPASAKPAKPGGADKGASKAAVPRAPRSAAVTAAPMPAKSAASPRAAAPKSSAVPPSAPAAGAAKPAGVATAKAAAPTPNPSAPAIASTPSKSVAKPASATVTTAKSSVVAPSKSASAAAPKSAASAVKAEPEMSKAPPASASSKSAAPTAAKVTETAPSKPAAGSVVKPVAAPKSADASAGAAPAPVVAKPQPNPANAIVSPPPPSPGRPGTPTGPRSGTGRPFSTFRSARPQPGAGRGFDEQQDAGPGLHDADSSDPPRPESIVSKANLKPVEFYPGDHVVYPTHGVGTVQGIETMQAAGMSLQMIVVTFDENRMTLKVPIGKAASSGLRKLATGGAILEALETLKGRARIKRTMWSRRAQEYEAKINSGDPVAIAEVVRDLHRNAGQPDQSFSERQIYEQAMDRLAAEVAAIDGTDKVAANDKLLQHLNKAPAA